MTAAPDSAPCPCEGAKCSLTEGDKRHGRKRSYDFRGCRCATCKGAKSEATRRARAADPARARARERASRLANPEGVRAYQARGRVVNAERRRETIRAWTASNPEKQAGYSAAYRERHRDRVRESARMTRERLSARSPAEIAADQARLRPQERKRCRACRLALPCDNFGVDRMRRDGLRAECVGCVNRRLRRIAAPRWADLDLYACIYCDAPFEHVDHVIPRALEGTDAPHNLVPSCAPCNLSKSDTPLAEWLARIGIHPALLAQIT